MIEEIEMSERGHTCSNGQIQLYWEKLDLPAFGDETMKIWFPLPRTQLEFDICQ